MNDFALVERVKASAPILMTMSMVLWLVAEALGAPAISRFGIPEVVWLRYLFHFLFMFVCIAPFRGLSFIRTSRPWLQLTRSLLMLAMPMSYELAVSGARSRDVLGVFWSAPLWVLAFAPLARDRVSAGAVVPAALGWIGALVLYRPALGAMDRSLIWLIGAFAMAASFSLYIVLTAVLDRTEGVLTNLFWSAVGVFAVLSFYLPTFWQPVGLESLLVTAGVGVLGWFALATLDLALRRAMPSGVACLLLIQPLAQVMLQVPVTGKAPRPPDIVGSVLMAGVIWLGLRRRPVAPGAQEA